MSTERIELTPDEVERLAISVRKGVAALVEIWDTLNQIGDRLGLDWEPQKETGSTSDIIEAFVSGCVKPGHADTITAEEVSEVFSSKGDWS